MAANLKYADGYSSQIVKYAAISGAASGNNTLVAAVAGKKIRVYNIVLISAGTMTVKFQSAAGGTDLTGAMTVAAGTGFAPGFDPTGHFETVAGELLNLVLSGATQASGWMKYALID